MYLATPGQWMNIPAELICLLLASITTAAQRNGKQISKLFMQWHSTYLVCENTVGQAVDPGITLEPICSRVIAATASGTEKLDMLLQAQIIVLQSPASENG